MLTNWRRIEKLSEKYSINKEDLILMSLNLSGSITQLSSPRLRMNLTLKYFPDEKFYFAIPNRINRNETDFEISNDILYLMGEEIGHLTRIENDDCSSSYFRRNNTVITLNSNRRSTCEGCKFCPNNLELNSEDLALDTHQKLRNHLNLVLSGSNHADMSGIRRLTICTGCFESEERTVQHLLMVYEVAKSMGFLGVLHYIGSQINSNDTLDLLVNKIDHFMYTMTVECFTNRSKLMNQKKGSLTLDDYKRLGAESVKRSITTSTIHILGLDSLQETIDGFRGFYKATNYFPIINLFQPHVPEHYDLLADDARDIEYYLTIRKSMEDLYSNANLKPKAWECYRSLWYYYYSNQKVTSVHI